MGGSATRGDVLDHVQQQLEHLLTDADFALRPDINQAKWEHRVDSMKQRLVQRGWIKSLGSAGWGMWEITQNGRSEFQEAE